MMTMKEPGPIVERGGFADVAFFLALVAAFLSLIYTWIYLLI